MPQDPLFFYNLLMVVFLVLFTYLAVFLTLAWIQEERRWKGEGEKDELRRAVAADQDTHEFPRVKAETLKTRRVRAAWGDYMSPLPPRG